MFNGSEYRDEAPFTMLGNRTHGGMYIDRSKGIGERYDFIKKLVEMKKSSEILQFGDEKCENDGKILYVKRTLDGREINLVMNFSGEEKAIGTPEGKIVLSQNYENGKLGKNGFLMTEKKQKT